MIVRSTDRDTVERELEDWPEQPRQLAEDLMNSYGPPDEVLGSRLVWHDNGTWKRTELHRHGVGHDFPSQHTDHLEQAIDYRVPPAKADDLLAFDGSLKIERTKGELSSRCRDPAMNILALNLAHDIVTGEKTVDEAREAYARGVVELEMGRRPSDSKSLGFSPVPDQGDPDASTVTAAMRKEIRDRMPGG